MAVDTFNPTLPPQEEPSGQGTLRAREIKFGDGYSASFGDGLNNEEQTWPMTYVGTDAEIAPILAFVRAHKGYISFYWTPPFGEQGYYQVKTYTIVPAAAGNAKLNITLVQVFRP